MCFTYYESFKNPEKKKIRNEEISNVTRLSTIDDRKFEKKEEKKETLFFFSQANRLFDKLVIRHRLPLRSIFFFDFHLKTTSGVHDSSLSPPPLLLLLPPSSSFLFSPNAFELRRLESGDLFKNIRTRVLDLGQPGHPRTALERNTRVSVHFFFFFQGAAKKLESHDRFREI